MRIPSVFISAAIFLASFTSSHAEAVVKIGVIYDFSGPYADIGGQGAVAAARMAIEAPPQTGLRLAWSHRS